MIVHMIMRAHEVFGSVHTVKLYLEKRCVNMRHRFVQRVNETSRHDDVCTELVGKWDLKFS